ncbi:hypothetical protein B7494_g1898 [Chlorociboria aeruginascens]|nr:hypothetical protein B7494_g1898 [Chlorociboria aeruginascens]
MRPCIGWSLHRPLALHPCRLLHLHSHLHSLSHPLSPARAIRNLRISPLTCPTSPAQNRGEKTKTSLKLAELPQGVIPLEPLPLEEDVPSYPTVVLQARSRPIRSPFKSESRSEEDGSGPVSMAGFPFFQLDRYLKILVQDFNRYVAIAEEFPNDVSGKVKAGGLLHDRRVSRIITPGTLIDENFMDPFSNNYVLSIHIHLDHVSPVPYTGHESGAHGFPDHLASTTLGLAWLDLSTGHFFTQSTSLNALPAFLARVGPREIVLDEGLQAHKDHGIFTVLEDDHHLITYTKSSDIKSIADWEPILESPISSTKAEEFTEEEVTAGSTLLHYVETRLQGSDVKLQPPIRQLDVMGIDKNTMRALEIKKTIRDDLPVGSLLHTVRRTVTKGGARLLDRWLTSPSTSLEIINSRLDLVTYMLNESLLREQVVILLRRTHDSHRLLQKFAFGRGDADDLLALASTIHATRDLVNTLNEAETMEICVRSMISRIHLDGPKSLASRIKGAIDEEGLVQQHRIEEGQAGEMQALAQVIVSSEGSKEDSNILPKGNRKKKTTSIREHYSDNNEAWIMKPAASTALQHLHQDLVSLSNEKLALSEDLSKRLRAASLTLRFTPGLGHICHVKGKDIKVDLADIRSVSSSKSTRSFHHPEWTDLGKRIDQCTIHIRAEEQRVFNSLREAVICNLVKLRRNATVLDELDIACSFAHLADEKRWTRPTLNASPVHKIVGGRHPTVEGGLHEEGRTFVTNDCFVGDVQKMWLITGPNMAGKSTFLRQNALITILAQVGSYVPAEYAELGIVDQIFSRVGSADNLYRDQSTFMVEMLETASILKNATSRSFVIMDEIGRGTTPNDGTAVAFACLHHLYHVNQCRALFATHFHALADLIKSGSMDVGFYCTDVEEDGNGTGGFRYVHRLREGVNRQSHALKVATLAGLPEEAISVAKKVLGTWSV